MYNFNYSTKQLSLTTAILFAVSICYSAYANTRILTPKSICTTLQAQGLIKGCQPGTPWAFEVVKHQAQFSFEPTQTEIFECYLTSGKGRHKSRCTFKGALTQFANQEDLGAGIANIRQQNYHQHRQADLDENVVRADTTLEHYVFYTNPAEHILAIFPLTEKLAVTLSAINDLGLVELE